jgi:hypothetical protein
MFASLYFGILVKTFSIFLSFFLLLCACKINKLVNTISFIVAGFTLLHFTILKVLPKLIYTIQRSLINFLLNFLMLSFSEDVVALLELLID